MKRLITLLLLSLSLTAQAQESRTVYCSISGTSGYVCIDYGQDDLRKNWIVNSNGTGINFRSIVSIMNYMSERGWRCLGPHSEVESSLLDPEDIDTTTIWIFSKEVTSTAEITEGIITRQTYLEQRYR